MKELSEKAPEGAKPAFDQFKEEKVEWVPPDDIMIPDVRVTSVVEEDKMLELTESIKEHGILQPIQVAEVEGQLILIDGLHRLIAAKRLGLQKVPIIKKPAKMDEVLIYNLIVNRQRGRSNPAQEAEIIKTLVDEYGMEVKDVAKQLGMSKAKATKLYKIASLPDEVKAWLANGDLPTEGAYFLTFLDSRDKIIDVARDAVTYDYTVEQIKARVQQELNPQTEAEPGGWSFTPAGEPVRQPFICALCGKPIEDNAVYAWFHPECLEQVKAAGVLLQQEGAESANVEATANVEESASVEFPKPKPKSDWWPY